MNKDRITYLYNQYLNDRCSEEELQELKRLLNDPENEWLFNGLLDEHWPGVGTEQTYRMSEERAEDIFQKIIITPQRTGLIRKAWLL